VERAALGAILSHADFAGRAALLDQVDAARVIGGCDCGCATVDLAAKDAQASHAIAYPIPNEAAVLDAQGEIVGGMLVFVRDGYLARSRSTATTARSARSPQLIASGSSASPVSK
jgi:hypothetical protein